MTHSISVEDAVKYGSDEALVLYHIRWWIDHNEKNKTNFRDGRYWTYNSVQAFAQQFPYFSEKQMRRILESLEKQGVILTSNYNKAGFDKTKWYALADDVPKWSIPSAQTGKSVSPNGQTNTSSEYQIKETDNTQPQISAQEWIGEVPSDHSSAPSWRFFARQCMSHPFPILPRQVKSRAHQFVDTQVKLEGDPRKDYREWCRYFTNWIKKQRFLDESGS